VTGVQTLVKADLPLKVYTAVMKEIATTTKGNLWSWKSGNGGVD